MLMEANDILLYMIGGLGQVLFTARMIIQWIYSEKAKDSIAPPIFWWLSVGGTILIIIYAGLRKDLIFVLAPSANLFFYIRNLFLLSSQNTKNLSVKAIIVIGVVCVLLIFATIIAKIQTSFMSDVPLLWMFIGITGSVLWMLRFFLQWFISEIKGKSILTRHFWFSSLGGASLLLAYSIFRVDVIFIIGYSFPIPIILRNLILIKRNREAAKTFKLDEKKIIPKKKAL